MKKWVSKAFRFTEFFAGHANVSRCLKRFGFTGLSFDNRYGGRYNNIFEPAGFACLGDGVSSPFCWAVKKESSQESKIKMPCLLPACCFSRYNACFKLRCAVLAILRLHPNSLVILAPVCSGFSFMCSSLAQRFFWCPEGVESLRWVRAGNIMANRVTLLCWLCAALGHTFLLEQPGSARLAALPRWQYFCRHVCWAAQLKHYLFPLEFV